MKTFSFHSWLAEDIRRFIQWREVLNNNVPGIICLIIMCQAQYIDE